MFPRHAFLDFEGRRLSGARPFAVWETRDGKWSWTTDSSTRFPFASGSGDVLEELQNALRWCKNEYSNGGALGFLAYDLARQIEPRAFRSSKQNDLPVPDARLVWYEELHNEPQPPIEHSDVAREDSKPEKQRPNPAYERAIAQILELIAAGDIYQANYTQRFSCALPCSPRELYERLRAQNPSPFGALLEWDDLAIVSNSPEKFLSLKNRVLEAQPIKGTMARGGNADEDEALKAQLHLSAKDRAENVMIVDLLRNDLGRVCEYGSVRVPELFAVQTFPTLHHLVSTVRGTLRANCDAVNAIRACFPCGSITGAPKIRAMQIIDELESVRRGAAMGALGCFAFNGDMHWNVAIRTVTCLNGQAFFNVGGGIVADSEVGSEYAEMQLKAAALKRALAA
ncbi:MAG TPA: aminodeoxychorismate synthase component I [Abditibacteriaceae bacterium]|jgi:para-aminobenzoate synthetase component 1|nr:aminodeoxychorismate synthase component I [Abditibacteriaceae bacterium]